MTKFHSGWHLAALAVACYLLVGCAVTSPSPFTLDDVGEQLNARYPALHIEPNALGKNELSLELEQPLSLQQAIHILLSRSPQVRLQLAELGIADAQRLQAELLANPHISIGALRPEGGGRWQLDTSLSQPLLGILTRPLRKQLAQENLLVAQLQLQTELEHLIAETSEQYFAAVAAMQHCDVQYNMLEATKAKQQLALSLYQAGNMSENNFLFYENELRRMEQQLEKRQAFAYETQLKLLHFIGLESHHRLNIPGRLPPLPNENFNHLQLFAEAKAKRADLNITQRQLQLVAKRQQLIGNTYGWRDMSLGINAEREFDGARNVGPEVEFALPIFNRGQGKLAAITAEKTKLEARLRQLELDADLQIAQSLNTMDSARSQLHILRAGMAAAEKRVALSHREVNFMLTSPLELLTIKRQQIQLAHEFTATLKNYWQARAQLELAVGATLNSDSANANSHSGDHGHPSQPQPEKHETHQEHHHD